MSSIKLDLKNFEYQSSDGNSTTLIHKKDGHQITLAHKPLSKENRTQLEAMSAPAKKMAEGGEIEDPQAEIQDPKAKFVAEARAATMYPPTPPTPEQEQAYNPGEPRNMIVDALGLPESLRISEADRARFDASLPMQMGLGSMGSIGVVGKAAKAIPQVIRVANDVAKVDGALGQASKGANLIGQSVFGKAKELGALLNKHGLPLKDRSAFVKGGEVKTKVPASSDVSNDINDDVSADPVSDIEYLKAPTLAEQVPPSIPESVNAAALQAMDPLQTQQTGEYAPPPNFNDYGGYLAHNRGVPGYENAGQTPEWLEGGQLAKHLGAAPGQTPAPQATMQAPPDVVTEQAQALPPASAPIIAHAEKAQEQSSIPQTSQANLTGSGLRDIIVGNNLEAKAQGDQGKADEKTLSDQINALKLAQETNKKQYDALDNERKNFIDDINNQHIDPEKYWTGDPKTGMGGHSKLMAGIGMILAGFNPTNSPNAAASFIEKQMEMNLEAQKQNLNSKHNLLSANMRQFGNMKDAIDMTRLMQSDMVKYQLMASAAKAQIPMAKAAALKAAGDLELKYAPLQQQIANNQTAQSLMTQGQKDPSLLPAAIQAIEQTDPKKAADLRNRLVPGVGIATTYEGARGLREMQTTVQTIKDSTNRLQKIASTPGKSLSPSLIAEADTIRSSLVGRLRVPITGPGSMSDTDRAQLMALVPDVTAIIALNSSNKKRLDTLNKTMQSNYDNMMRANGIYTQQPQQSGNSRQFKTLKYVGK